MKIRVEFLRPIARESDVYSVGRIPCVGECVTTDGDDNYTVHSVFHCLNADPETSVLAIVRVR